MVLITKRLAMFLLRSGITLCMFLTLGHITVQGSDTKNAVFTTKPKNKVIFVGDNVVFDWDYRKEENVESVSFGVATMINGTTKMESFLVKKTVIFLNTRIPKFKELIKRVQFVKGKRASLEIKNVRMNDTATYFCTLKRKEEIQDITEYVDLKVVDLQIDEKASRSEEESWINQKLSLVCMVRVVKDEPVTFTWLRQPDNKTLSRGKHIDTQTESILTVITSSDYHFTTYTCVAKTKKTTVFHNVVVRRLYGPGPPLNLQQQYIFDKDRGESFHKVFWTAPKTDGGAKVIDYIVEYKPQGIAWEKAMRAMTKKTTYSNFKLKEGKKYDVRVLARNKVDEGSYSNEVEIKLGGYPSTGARSNSSNIHHSTWWSCLLSFTLLVAKLKW